MVYIAATVAMGRDVLTSIGSRIVNDAGDPVLNAAILAWNARHVPWTDAWFNFPAFHPLTDILTFSEHLLGVSVLSTPVFWLTGNPVTAYNVAVLATPVLSGLAMCALVLRLTQSSGAAVVAGMAYAFAPYRVAHLPHIQVLAAFWAPLALLGLHAYLETRRRRWLALFAACWFMQGAANGYFLVFFSVLCGLWVLWFVVAQGRWRDLGMIAGAGVIALLPMLAILKRFVDAHERYGLTRGAEEITSFSADIASVLCAHADLAAWGWIDVGEPVCRGERQLFPGVALLVLLCVTGAGAWLVGRRLRSAPRPSSRLTVSMQGVSALLFVAGAALLAAAADVAMHGPSAWSIGPLRASASTVQKPFTQGLLVLVAALVLLPAFRKSLRPATVHWFYGLAAVATWMFAWGPTPLLNGQPALETGPYGWLMLMPGLDGLRVPARFWMMTVLCLSVLLGCLVARTLEAGLSRALKPALLAIAGLALLLDGWTTIRTASIPAAPPRPDLLRGSTVITLPIADHLDEDAAAELNASAGGWASVNGYSGYEPRHYGLLRYASNNTDTIVVAPFLARGDLNIVVYEHTPRFIEMVERLPGVKERGRGNGLRQYWVPKQGVVPASVPSGERRQLASVSASCAPEHLPLVQDGDLATRWECGPQRPTQAITVDLGSVGMTGTVVPALGTFATDFPRQLRIETSTDAVTWDVAWEGGVLPALMEASLRDSEANRLVLAFAPRQARYVRLRLMSDDKVWYWSIAELEVWTGSSVS